MNLITSLEDTRLPHCPDRPFEQLLCDSLRVALKKLRDWEEGWNITEEDVKRVQESDSGKIITALRSERDAALAQLAEKEGQK